MPINFSGVKTLSSSRSLALRYLLSLLIMFALVTIVSACKNSESKLTPFEHAISVVYKENPQDISPVLLNKIYKYGSEFTNLQREEVAKKISGKVIVWQLKVYEIRKLDNWTVRIQTETGRVDNRNDAQKLYQQLFDFGALATTGESFFEKSYAYQSVSTMITLKVRDESEWQFLSTLKTGDFIKVRGRISGVSALRDIEIDPAVLDSNENLNVYRSRFQQSTSPPNSGKETRDQYLKLREKLISEGWKPLVRTNPINGWKGEYPENQVCDEGSCMSEFVKGKEVTVVRYYLCTEQDYDHIEEACKGLPKTYQLAYSVQTISLDESNNNFEKLKLRFE